MIESLTGTHGDWAVAIARIVLGIVFFAHGAQKMLGWYGGPGLASSMRTFTEHLHLPSTMAFLVIAGELISGIGLIVGLFSRIAALVIVLTMVGAIATVHFRFGLFLNWVGSQEGHGIEYHLLAIALAQRGKTQDNDQSNCDLDCSPDARTAYDLVAMVGLPRLDGSPGILHAPPGTPLRPDNYPASTRHIGYCVADGIGRDAPNGPALTRCAAWDFRRRTRLSHQLWLGCVYGRWTSRQGRYGESTIG